jgi:hypothetical protein
LSADPSAAPSRFQSGVSSLAFTGDLAAGPGVAPSLIKPGGSFFGAIMSLDSLFGGKKMQMPALPSVPTRADPAVEDARRRALIDEQKNRGAGANYLTSGKDLGPSSVAQKYLLGA